MKHRSSSHRCFLAAGVVAGALALAFLAGSRSLPAAAIAPPCTRARVRPPQPVDGSGANPATADYAALLTPSEAGEVPPLLRASLGSELEVGGELSGRLGEYDPTGIRRLRQTKDGAHTLSYYYIPGRRTSLIGASCLRTLSAEERKVVRTYERYFPPGPAYCLVGIVGGGAFPVACGTLEAPLPGYAFGLVRSYRDDLVGLVPDGVAAVRISYRSGVATTGAVSNNLFIAPAPKPATREFPCEIAAARGRGPRRRCTKRERLAQVRSATPLAVSWLSSTGAIVRRFALTPAYLRDAEETEGLIEPFVDS